MNGLKRGVEAKGTAVGRLMHQCREMRNETRVDTMDLVRSGQSLHVFESRVYGIS